MKHLLILFFLVTGKLSAQNNVAHFSYWKPSANFDKGYQQHLKWHKDNGDKWSWYGWYIISGPRHDQFIDATFNHAWSDFDNPVNPSGDAADNDLHTFPFGEYLGGCKMINLPELSNTNSNLQSKFLHAITVPNLPSVKKIIEKYKSSYQTFLTFKIADGGDLHQIILFIGLNSFNEFSKLEPMQDELSAIASKITAETLLYKANMTLLQE